MDPELSLKRLGKRLKALRIDRNLTQVEVANLACLPRLKVIQVEAGSHKVSALAYAKIAAALGAEIDTVAARRPTLDELRGLN